MKKILSAMAMLAVASFIACIRETQLETEVGDLNTIVVDGDFTDSNGPHRVRLTRPSKYGISKFEDITDAFVRLHDDAGNVANYWLRQSGGGYFYELSPGAVPVVPGRAYHIEILMADGRRYLSSPQKMPPKVKADTILVDARIVPRVSGVDLVVEDKRAFATVQTALPANEDELFLRWDAHCVYYFPELTVPGSSKPSKQCYVTEFFNAQNIPLERLNGQNGRTIRKEVGSKLIDKAFGISLYFKVVQRSMNIEAFKFWEGFTKIANPQGTVFDPPPGHVRGNIFNPNDSTEVPLGFFEVASVDTLRRKVFNGDLGPEFYVIPPCDPNYADTYTKSECFDCLLLKNSTTLKPTWWK